MPCRVAISLYLTLHCRHPELLELPMRKRREKLPKGACPHGKGRSSWSWSFRGHLPFTPAMPFLHSFPSGQDSAGATSTRTFTRSRSRSRTCTLHFAPLDWNLVIRAHFDLRLPAAPPRPDLTSSHLINLTTSVHRQLAPQRLCILSKETQLLSPPSGPSGR